MLDLQKSPIRKNIKELQEDQLSIFESDDLFEHGKDEEHTSKYQVRTILKDVENMLGVLEENQKERIKIAVMGEVKAGKSTFINVCVGKKVAYTDILEATAIVSEITYSEEECARILDKQGNIVKSCSFEELLKWTEEKLDEAEDFSEYEKIEIFVNNPFLENIVLVDTPGLLSITSENHEVTNEYIAQTDYILWVINSRNLGSKSVNDYIDKIKLSGKPLFGIINKVDSKEELMEIKEYSEKEYSTDFDEMFYISAYNAWQAFTSNDSEWEEHTGFSKLLDCIQELAEGKDRSSKKTQLFQLKREREIHMKMNAIISARKETYDNELAIFSKINNEIKKTISKELDNWVLNEVYMDEKMDLMNAKEEEFHILLEKYCDKAYFLDLMNNKCNEISIFVQKKWEEAEGHLKYDPSQFYMDFSYDKIIVEDSSVGIVDNSAGTVTEWTKKGVIAGLAFAGYSAWLGPAAATVTFAGAFVPCVVPFAIGGAIVGMVFENEKINTAKLERGTRKKQEIIDKFYIEVIKRAGIGIKGMERKLYEYTNKYLKERHKIYKEKVQLFHFDFTNPFYGKFISELEQYIKELEDAIAELDEEKIVKPINLDETGEYIE